MEETALHQAAGVFPYLCSPNNFVGLPSLMETQCQDQAPKVGSYLLSEAQPLIL